MAYATRRDFEKRLGASTVARLYDELNSGNADDDSVTALLLDASAKVDSYLAPLGMLPLTEPYPREVTRLTLDVAQAYAYQRYPESVHGDWEKLMKQAEADLCKLRDGKTMLGTNPVAPDPPANHGGEVFSNVVGSDEAETPSPWDDFGDF